MTYKLSPLVAIKSKKSWTPILNISLRIEKIKTEITICVKKTGKKPLYIHIHEVSASLFDDKHYKKTAGKT